MDVRFGDSGRPFATDAWKNSDRECSGQDFHEHSQSGQIVFHYHHSCFPNSVTNFNQRRPLLQCQQILNHIYVGRLWDCLIPLFFHRQLQGKWWDIILRDDHQKRDVDDQPKNQQDSWVYLLTSWHYLISCTLCSLFWCLHRWPSWIPPNVVGC